MDDRWIQASRDVYLYTVPEPVRLDLVNCEEPTAAVNVRYRPSRRGQEGT